MSGSKIRRAQLVSPFGVGAMSVLVNGTSVVTAGLDHWYPENSPDFDYQNTLSTIGGLRHAFMSTSFGYRPTSACPDTVTITGTLNSGSPR